MAPRTAKPAAPADPTALKRASAGRYVTGDERFTVEQGANGWMILDAEQTDDFGLPLVRGPFATLDLAKAALSEARTGPAPTSGLATRAPKTTPATRTAPAKASAAAAPKAKPKAPPPPPPVKVRTYRSGDGDALRALWEAVDFGTHGDDDSSLRAFSSRNPGMFLVATRGDDIVGSAMGAWDGRRGWIYHVAVTEDERRSGLASDLVGQVERELRKVGCRRVNVVVRDGNDDGRKFWEAAGYERRDNRVYGRDLSDR
jgi:ribosomal protein S18 acetylase RimI-like enzyme